jgi:hypothetical protein
MADEKKRYPGVLIVGEVTEDGITAKAQNVIVEETYRDPGEVVYESSESRGKSFSGHSRAFSDGWDRMMEGRQSGNMPN